jgi:hypothetical protein
MRKSTLTGLRSRNSRPNQRADLPDVEARAVGRDQRSRVPFLVQKPFVTVERQRQPRCSVGETTHLAHIGAVRDRATGRIDCGIANQQIVV